MAEDKVYHVTKRKDGRWQVKGAASEKAIKIFDSYAEAVEYTKNMAANQDASIKLHRASGAFSKRTAKAEKSNEDK